VLVEMVEDSKTLRLHMGNRGWKIVEAVEVVGLETIQVAYIIMIVLVVVMVVRE